MKNTFNFLILALAFLLMPSPGQASTKCDASLMISATTVMQRIHQKERIFLVDIRHEKEFNKLQIPGSLNIPLSFLKTKAFLKTKPIVLINRGFGYTEMITQAKKLNQNGFNIKILKGGLLTWKHKNGTLVGDPFFPKELNKISSKTFFPEKDCDEIRIINAGKKVSKKIKSLILKAVHLPEINEKAIKETLSFLKKNPMDCVVVFNETGKNYSNFEKHIPNAFYHKVFYLKGGMQAYQTFLKYQMLANKPKSQRIKETGHCEPCKKQDKE